MMAVTRVFPNKSNLTVFFFCPESVGLFGGVDLTFEFFRIVLVPPLNILKNFILDSRLGFYFKCGSI